MCTQSATRKETKVSCLMVTANRKLLMHRSVECYNKQTYHNKEIVIVDDGEEDLSEVLEDIPKEELVYIKIKPSVDNTLGKLRNIALEHAKGEYRAQWDDDDWYHPDRLAIQAQILDQGYDACCLNATLMHLDTPRFVDHPFVSSLPEGVPGTIMHRKDGNIRYPHTRRAEDTVYLEKWMDKKYKQLSSQHAYLFIRCFHGNNTWDKEHFERRFKNSPIDYLRFLWCEYVNRDLFCHPRFHLTQTQYKAFLSYLGLSKKLKLVTSRDS